ncbi:MAG: carboxypeptidase regulatory-like domain-containing protein [Acidobacteriaceae bacterium]
MPFSREGDACAFLFRVSVPKLNRSLLQSSIILMVFGVLGCVAAVATDQVSTSAGTLQGTITDPSGALIGGATIALLNAPTGFKTTTVADTKGHYLVPNLPFNPYHVTVSAPGFAPAQFDVELRSPVVVTHDLSLQLATSVQSVNVEASGNDMVETDTSSHTDVSQQMISRLPIDSNSSALTSVITQTTPGMTQDSNGMFHPLGEHADSSFSIDGQNVSDQQSRTFANAIPVNAVQSLEVITGAIPPEYGDKASAIIRTTTKSGLGSAIHGSSQFSYGTFGTSNGVFSLSGGNQKFGNFITIDGSNSGRFLDTPEFQVLHAHGNNEDVFDRFDWQQSAKNSYHVNLGVSRAWFQVPNQYDQQALGQDQRQQNKGFNASGFWTHIFDDNQLAIFNVYARQDRVGYYPSADPFSDTPATLQQTRRLTNLGAKLDYSYVKGAHNIKIGANLYHTLLSEEFATGITDPAFNAICLDAAGNPVTNPAITTCVPPALLPNPGFQPGLLPFDLSRGGMLFRFRGHADIRQEAAYIQDNINLNNFQFLVGVRGDNYDGLSSDHAIQPRLGVTYNVKKTGTVFRLGYGRLFITPYNENLVLSSSTGVGGLESGAFGVQPLRPGNRNQFNAGFSQAFGKYLVVNAEYFWKFTQRDFDFDTILNTPLTFPIEWRKSKIDGFAIRVNMPNIHGVTASSVLGHARSRFFGPEIGGILFNDPALASSTAPFRIDHDQALETTTHVQYQPRKEGGWVGLTWRYDSGTVAGNIPDQAVALGLTPDQQQQAGLFCGGIFATLSAPIRSCPGLVGAARINIPAPGTFNPDRNPARIAPRNLFDLGLGWENILHRDRLKTNLTLTVVNLTDKEALYNFLSTFSGTHFVSPRTVTGQVEFNF